MIRFTEDHEWISLDGNIALVGITNFAQHSLGDVVFVELPAVGKNLLQGEVAAVVESVKAASEIYSPVDGRVIEVSENLEHDPSLINTSPEEFGWMFMLEIDNNDQFGALMTREQYEKFIEGM